MGGEIRYIDLRERKVVEKAIKKSEEERSQSYLAQLIKDIVGRMQLSNTEKRQHLTDYD